MAVIVFFKIPEQGRQTMQISYGPEPTSHGELLLPDGPGPFPVVMLIHGGCWLAQLGAMEDYRTMAELLRGGGIATWNIEYRRVGHDGGGWPGTFLDLGKALDHIGVLGRDHPLDISRTIALGHSSGGHFAAWLAIRDQLPQSSDIKGEPKVSLAGTVLADAFIDPRVMDSTGLDGALFCGEPVLARLLGAEPDAAIERLAEISPLNWLPWGIPQHYVLSSRRYPVTPRRPLADGRTTMAMPDYPALAREAGDECALSVIEDAGHFDFIEAPASDAFIASHQAVLQMVDRITKSSG